jgi:hypothetical protein
VSGDLAPIPERSAWREVDGIFGRLQAVPGRRLTRVLRDDVHCDGLDVEIDRRWERLVDLGKQCEREAVQEAHVVHALLPSIGTWSVVRRQLHWEQTATPND